MDGGEESGLTSGGSHDLPATDDSGGSTEGEPVCADGGAEPGTPRWSHVGEPLANDWSQALATTPALETVYAREFGDRVVLEVFAADGTHGPFAEYAGGLPGHGSRSLGVAVDDAGFVHVLLSETVTYVQTDDFEPPTQDERLVVLRYAPDGELEWRRERDRPPVAAYQQFVAAGRIGSVGDAIHVLELDDSPGVFRLDANGEVTSEVTLAIPADMSIRSHDLAPDGAPVLAGHAWNGSAVTVWIGRFAFDGSLLWSDRFADIETDVTAVVAGRGDDTFLASYSFPTPETYEVALRRYDADGRLTASGLLPPVTIRAGARGAASGCGAEVVLIGRTAYPPPMDGSPFRDDLWVAGYDGAAAEVWSYTHQFGETVHQGEGSLVTTARDGDVLVLGYYNADESVMGPTEWRPWLARLSGG